MSKSNFTRRGVLRTGAMTAGGLALPTILTAASHSGFTNAPAGATVTLGFNVPQTGPYADEGADELRAYARICASQRAEVVRHALHVRLAGRVVPRAAVVQRILSGHQLRAARLAHGLRKIGAIKRQPLPGQAIDVRGFGILAAVQWQIIVGAVIGHDDEKVGPLGQHLTRLAKRNKKQQQKKPNHGPPSFQPKHPQVKSFSCVGVVAAFCLLGFETGAGAEEFYFMGLHSCDDASPADHGLFVAV